MQCRTDMVQNHIRRFTRAEDASPGAPAAHSPEQLRGSLSMAADFVIEEICHISACILLYRTALRCATHCWPNP